MSRRAKQAARQVLDRVGFGIPVDVQAIAADYGLAIRHQPLEDEVSGLLVVKDGHALIGVNAAHHVHRQRFTIAHELGHYLLHRAADNVFIDASSIFYRDATSADGSKRQEIEANAFASELLMPEDVIRERLGNHPLGAFDDSTIRKLADEIDVSVQALTIRLTQLGLIWA